MKYHDITPEVTSELAVFPGDKGFERQVALDMKKGHNITLSAIHTTLHLGAHVDAPLHYTENGAEITARPLDIYLGRAQVITVKKGPHERVQVEDLKKHPIDAPRVLLRTQSFENPNQWTNDFTAYSAAAIEYLAGLGVKLIGIDTPSVDLADSKSLESHKMVAKHDMSILEGIVLTSVADGIYTLIALPLKLKGADASPVRAILIEKDLGLG